jgi:hypothetical protein
MSRPTPSPLPSLDEIVQLIQTAFILSLSLAEPSAQSRHHRSRRRSVLRDGHTTQAAQIGPGDDVFMVGRFIDHDGGNKNRPALRFGNISIDPTPIMQDNGVRVPAYCVDLHSRTGFSGSPVFVYRTPGPDLDPPPPRRTPNLGLQLLPEESVFFMVWEYTSLSSLNYGK